MASDLNGPATFADDGRTIIERPVETHSVRHDEIYEIERTVGKILEGSYEKVGINHRRVFATWLVWVYNGALSTPLLSRSQIAVQFPDELLADSTAVVNQLRVRAGKKVYILADTSYGRWEQLITIIY